VFCRPRVPPTPLGNCEAAPLLEDVLESDGPPEYDGAFGERGVGFSALMGVSSPRSVNMPSTAFANPDAREPTPPKMPPLLLWLGGRC